MIDEVVNKTEIIVEDKYSSIRTSIDRLTKLVKRFGEEVDHEIPVDEAIIAVARAIREEASESIEEMLNIINSKEKVEKGITNKFFGRK